VKYDNDFIYKKVEYITDDKSTIYWYLIHKTRREGVHFWGWANSKTMAGMHNSYGFYAAGIEGHRKTPHYKDHKPMSNCYVTQGYCYHDGSSLQASERLGHINPSNSFDNEYIWYVLHEYFDAWVKEQSDENK